MISGILNLLGLIGRGLGALFAWLQKRDIEKAEDAKIQTATLKKELDDVVKADAARDDVRGAPASSLRDDTDGFRRD